MADLSKVTFEFSQEGNTNGTTEECEELDIIVDSPCFINRQDGSYVVLKTKTGWSIDNSKELTDIIDKCIKFSEGIIE